ncbi:MAG TPA: hypothetical protein DEB06_06550, partial [Phycisphaerales bacterium]|nr:hypothetical protein [Phycisphaerales bacterium]
YEIMAGGGRGGGGQGVRAFADDTERNSSLSRSLAFQGGRFTRPTSYPFLTHLHALMQMKCSSGAVAHPFRRIGRLGFLGAIVRRITDRAA